MAATGGHRNCNWTQHPNQGANGMRSACSHINEEDGSNCGRQLSKQACGLNLCSGHWELHCLLQDPMWDKHLSKCANEIADEKGMVVFKLREKIHPGNIREELGVSARYNHVSDARWKKYRRGEFESSSSGEDEQSGDGFDSDGYSGDQSDQDDSEHGVDEGDISEDDDTKYNLISVISDDDEPVVETRGKKRTREDAKIRFPRKEKRKRVKVDDGLSSSSTSEQDIESDESDEYSDTYDRTDGFVVGDDEDPDVENEDFGGDSSDSSESSDSEDYESDGSGSDEFADEDFKSDD